MVWALIGHAVFLVSTILMSGIATRVLSPSDAGRYFLALSIATTAAALAEFGLRPAGVRLIAESLAMRKPGRAKAALRHVVSAGLLSTILVTAILVSPVGRGIVRTAFAAVPLAEVIVLIALLGACRALGDLRAEVIRGFSDIRLASVFKGADAGALGALALIGVYLLAPEQATLQLVLGLTIVAWVPGLLVGYTIIHARWRGLSGPETISRKQVFFVAWPMMITGLAGLLMAHADLWVVGAVLAAPDVSLYAAALRVLALVSVPLVVVNAVVPPLIADLYTRGEKGRLERLLRVSATLAALPALASVAVFAVAGGPMLRLVFGPFYAEAGLLLVVLSAGKLVNVCAGSGAHLLAMTGHEQLSMKITAASALAMIGLAAALVHPFGLLGVASAAALGVAGRNVALVLAARRMTGIWSHLSLSATVATARTLWRGRVVGR